MGGILSAIQTSAQGLSTQRAKMNVVAQNIANAETVETKEGGPYQRKRIIATEAETKTSFNTLLTKARSQLSRTNSGHIIGRSRPINQQIKISGVEHKEVTDPDSAFRLVYDPDHPNSNEEGFVKTPDIDVMSEMVDMMSASRAYEANTSVISSAKKMARDALEI